MTTAADMLANPITAATPLAGDEAFARTVTLKRIVLNNKRMKTDLINATQDVRVKRTIEGASTLELVVYDPRRLILRSTLINKASTVVIDDLSFTLAGFGWSSGSTTLTFEDTNVNRLRQNKKPRKMARNSVTRAQFAGLVVKETPGIEFVCPELNIVQPIGRVTKKTRSKHRDPGFGPRERFTIKGKRADSEQRSNMERVLDVGFKKNYPRVVLLAAALTLIVESEARNLDHGDRDSLGLFQQRASWGSATDRRNPEKAAQKFYTKAMREYRKNKTIAAGVLAQKVQRSATPTAYTGRKAEGEAIVKLYFGGKDGETAIVDSRTATKKYEFTRGLPGGKKGEDSWTCLLRIADEVQWRCFSSRRQIYFVSETRLFQSASIATISPDDDFVEDLGDLSGDIGIPISETQFTVHATRWSVAPGQVITLTGTGPGDGRWLVVEIDRSLFSTMASITIRKPTAALPEPPAEDNDGTDGATDGLDPKIAKAVAKMKAIDGKYPYLYGAGHGRSVGPTNGGKLDCSGSVSWVLEAAGVLGSPTPRTSGSLLSWGRAGEGKYLTVWTNPTHVWIELKLPGQQAQHWGTGRYGTSFGGFGLKPKMHPKGGFTPRHIENL